MLKIAHNISNLSDARYFAAAGFDWLIFNFGPGAAEHRHLIYGIAEWISGSHVGMHVNNQIELNYHLEHHPEIKGFWLSPDMAVPAGLLNYTLFSTQPSESAEPFYQIISDIDDLKIENSILDLTPLDPESIDLNKLRSRGITLSGTEEEQPGFKSYGNMEVWMDKIDEIES